MKQGVIAPADWAHVGNLTRRERLFWREGYRDPLGADQADYLAVLTLGGHAQATDAAGADAAHLFHAMLAAPLGPGLRGFAV